MRHPIPIKILDRAFTLSDLERYQVENMVWLKLAPVKSRISDVKILLFEKPSIDGDFWVSFRVQLNSGFVVEVDANGESKRSCWFVPLGELLKKLMRGSGGNRHSSTV